MRGTVEYRRIEPGMELPDLQQKQPFRAVIILATDYTTDWQNLVSKWLIEGGCLYSMAWGPNCSSWDDSVDWATIDQFQDFEIPPDRFVMTTWHPSETLESVFWFAQFNAERAYDDQPLDHTVLIDVSSVDRRDQLFDLFERSSSRAEREEHDGE